MLETHDLTKVYAGRVTALRNVRLRIDRGLFGLLGPNGAGKTTLMRVLAGLLEPTSGRVVFAGEDVTTRPERVWPRLGYLPQSFGLYPNLSGRAMLDHLLRLKGVAADGGLGSLVAELLERVNLSAAADRKVKHYSGGMKQRIGIAQAIAGDPELIIVDEPTAGLDPEERMRFYRLLADLAASRTIILSTHIVEDVATLCPRFAVIRGGRVLKTTTPSQARAAIAGTVYEGHVSGEALARFGLRHAVIQSVLVEGRHRARIQVVAGEPPAGFAPVAPTLADAYLLLVRADETPDRSAA